MKQSVVLSQSKEKAWHTPADRLFSSFASTVLLAVCSSNDIVQPLEWFALIHVDIFDSRSA